MLDPFLGWSEWKTEIPISYSQPIALKALIACEFSRLTVRSHETRGLKVRGGQSLELANALCTVTKELDGISAFCVPADWNDSRRSDT